MNIADVKAIIANQRPEELHLIAYVDGVKLDELDTGIVFDVTGAPFTHTVGDVLRIAEGVDALARVGGKSATFEHRTVTPTHVLGLRRPLVAPGVIAFSVYAVETSPGVYAVEGHGVIPADMIVTAETVDEYRDR